MSAAKKLLSFLYVLAAASPAGAKEMGDIVVFRCEIPEKSDSLLRAVAEPEHARMDGDRLITPRAQIPDPQIILTLPKNALVAGGNVLIKERQDIVSLFDQSQALKEAKQFNLSGNWPGSFTLTGSKKGVELAKISLSQADNEMADYPRAARIDFAPANTQSSTGICSVGYLTPLRR